MKVNRNQKLYSVLLSLIAFFISSNILAQDFECSDCHDNVIANSVHNEIIGCGDCHSDVSDETHAEKGVKKVSCIDCHEEYATLVNNDIHHRLKDKVKNPPDCKTCHGGHNIISPSSVKNKSKQYCSSCHANAILANPYHSKAEPNETCYDCHDGPAAKEKLMLSVHPSLNCADCHNYISHNLQNHPENVTKTQKADCYLCHSEIAKQHRESVHGISLQEGIDEAAQCWDCHGSHSIFKVKAPESKVYPTNLAETCGKCHNDPKIVEKFDIPMTHPGTDYSTSVHGQIVAAGGDAADCATCHGVHDIQAKVQPESLVNTYNVPNTCGKCHAEIAEEYMESIHWIRAKKGVRMSPVCNDCHSEHEIGSVGKQRSEIRKIQEQTCMECHQNPMLSQRYHGLEGQALQYQDSYHGLAVMRGDTEAAMCVDCHGVHKILPAKHPESTVSENNVVETCKKCHAEANDTFSKSYSHQSLNETAAEIESYVKEIYFWLIILIIGGMVAHNLLIFIYELKAKKKKEAKAKQVITRFTRNEVVQHFLLLTSFILLVITGFALKYPGSFWVQALTSLGMSETVRQVVHKSSAVLMIGLSLYHVVYLVVTGRGRFMLKKLVPQGSDLVQAIQTLAYYLKLSKKKPEYNVFDYTEKAEYWALVWGTFVMGATGLILWFPTIIGDWAPVWLIKVSETIHFYEAILASLAILVWHWFFVMFRPSSYPMSFVWINGKLDFEHYRHHHEEHFKEFVLEMKKLETKSIKEEKISNFSRIFIDRCKEENLDHFHLINEELESDAELRGWVIEKLGE